MNFEIVFEDGNRVTLLENQSYLQKINEEINKAKEFILIEVYILQLDPYTKETLENLKSAATRGVKVSIIFDSLGSHKLSNKDILHLKKSGLELIEYHPIKFMYPPYLFKRNHRKVSIFDYRAAFVGSCNLVQNHFNPDNAMNMIDLNIHVEGPVVEQIYKKEVRLLKKHFSSNINKSPKNKIKSYGSTPVAYISRSNFRGRESLRKTFKQLLKETNNELLIANSYFFPNLRFTYLLLKAAKRGIKIKILTQGKSDHPIFVAASRIMQRELSAQGVKFYEYNRKVLHAKTAVFDKRYCILGSSNIEPTGLSLNLEADLVFDSPELAQELSEKINTWILDETTETGNLAYKKASFFKKVLHWFAYYLGIVFYWILTAFKP